MPIKLPDDKRQRAIVSIRRYFDDQLDEEIGEMRAGLLLDFVLREIGPSVYNQGVLDAQAWLHERVTDLDGSCHEPEFGYWER